MNQAPGVFESFNARFLSLSQVSRTFVPSDHYRKLIKRSHTLVVGPRGSGKTTLLKMLQQPALETWNHQDADDVRSRLEFTGVFVPSDIIWQQQVAGLGQGQLDPVSHSTLTIAAFTTHVLRALVDAFVSRVDSSVLPGSTPFRRVALSQHQEMLLARELCDGWYLKGTIPTLRGIKWALTRRMSDIKILADQEVQIGEVGRGERLGGREYLYLNFNAASVFGIQIFDDIVEEKDQKWALMFDELEVAPMRIHEDLLRALRATDQRLLFKLALSPFLHNSFLMSDPTSPSPLNDFEEVTLWYTDKRDSYQFCQSLWLEMLQDRGYEASSPKRVLGTGFFETPAAEWAQHGTAYRRGSKIHKRFVSLASKDGSFRRYLRDKGIDLEDWDSIGGDERAETLRKVGPVVTIRDFYRRPDRDSRQAPADRTRKSGVLFAGADSVFAISEGNPRWFIAIMSKLLERWGGAEGDISQALQAREVVAAAERFAAQLKTIALGSGQPGKASRSLLSLIRTIGQYFHSQTVLDDFKAEPPGAFTVDTTFTGDVVAGLGQGINAGALVYIPDLEGQKILTSLRGKRFRLSYLLAPLYRFPLRAGKEVNLSTILSQSGGLSSEQLTLDEALDDEGITN